MFFDGIFLNMGMAGDVLITSRNSTTPLYWIGIEVSDMEPQEAATLLSNTAGRLRPEDRTTQDELLKDLGYLPLAVDQAGSYIFETGITLQEYHRWFQDEKSRLLRQHPSTQYNIQSRETVMTTWELSYQRIQSANAHASTLM